jgi:hypothetical protein
MNDIRKKNRKRNSTPNRRRVKSLERRVAFLEGIDTVEKRVEFLERAPRNSSRDQAEIAALKWLLETVVPEWLAEDPFIEILWSDDPFAVNAGLEDVESLLGRVVLYRPQGSLSPPRHYRIVSARFVSKIDEDNVIRLGMIPTEDDTSRGEPMVVAGPLTHS